MTQRYQPAIDRAVGWLRDKIEKGQIARGELLPPVRALARSCETRTATMQKAIAVRRKSGQIIGEHRQVLMDAHHLGQGSSIKCRQPNTE